MGIHGWQRFFSRDRERRRQDRPELILSKPEIPARNQPKLGLGWCKLQHVVRVLVETRCSREFPENFLILRTHHRVLALFSCRNRGIAARKPRVNLRFAWIRRISTGPRAESALPVPWFPTPVRPFPARRRGAEHGAHAPAGRIRTRARIVGDGARLPRDGPGRKSRPEIAAFPGRPAAPRPSNRHISPCNCCMAALRAITIVHLQHWPILVGKSGR